jgi:hypothetical protein
MVIRPLAARFAPVTVYPKIPYWLAVVKPLAVRAELKLLKLFELFKPDTPTQEKTSAQGEMLPPVGSIPTRPKLLTVPTLEVRVPIGLEPEVTPATENHRLRLEMVFAPPEV